MHIPTVIVIGGGEVGAVAVRQILSACARGQLEVERVRVVDRRADCQAGALAAPCAGTHGPEVRVETADWSAWLDLNLGQASPEDHLVPYHWAPHLLFEWLAGQVTRAGGAAGRSGSVAPRGLLFEAPCASGDRALSHAGWLCPPLCIEPAVCPHTQGPRHWSLATELRALTPADEVHENVVFPCFHLTSGVGTVPVSALHAAALRLVGAMAGGERRYLVATASHCHGLAARMVVVPRAVVGNLQKK